MVNCENFFGVREVDPFSMRQKMLKCKAQGLVFDAVEDKCRPKRTGGRKSVGPSVASLRAACKAQGLVLDMDSKQCRGSRRGVREVDPFSMRQKMLKCKNQGLVFDAVEDKCRPKRTGGRKSGLEAAYARGSLFFGGREVDPFSMRQKMLKCKEQGLVFDAVEDKCRPKRTGGRKSAGPTVASLRAACKAQGLVLDMDSK